MTEGLLQSSRHLVQQYFELLQRECRPSPMDHPMTVCTEDGDFLNAGQCPIVLSAGAFRKRIQMVALDVLMPEFTVHFFEVKLTYPAFVTIVLLRFANQRRIASKEIRLALSPCAFDKFLLLTRG